MSIVQVIIDDSANKTITGVWVFEGEGKLAIPHGTSFPVAPAANELFWRDDEVKLYKRNAGNTTWEAVVAAVAVHGSAAHSGTIGGEAQVTFDSGAGHAHTGADSKAVDHASLLSKGSNAHSAIDTHLASTSNPHSTTKAQVGLTNVTDDAQLKRAAGDIASFTTKATPVSGDLLIIEDSADSNNKKKITVGSLPGGSGTDANAIHKNVAAEISTITEKTAIHRNDLLVIEDSEAANAKKRVLVKKLLAAEPDYFAGEVRFYDEFFPPILDDMWTTSVSGTGSLVEVGLLPGGQVLVRAGNAAGRYAELYFGGGVAWQSLTLNPRISMRAKYDGTSNGHIEFEVQYTDASNYVLLRADWGGNWFLETRSGGVSTNVDTGIALDNAWHVLEVRASPTSVTAYIDGTLRATSTTNIPTVSGTVSVYVSATGTGGQKNLLIDGFFYCSARPT